MKEDHKTGDPGEEDYLKGGHYKEKEMYLAQ
jgi:hypothetical protein